MDAELELPAEEIRRLQRCVNDLVSALALPAIWIGGEPSQIVHILLDSLLGMLRLDFVYARLKDPIDEAPIEIVRVAQSQRLMAGTPEIVALFRNLLGDEPQKWPPTVRNPIGDEDISIVPLRLGLHDEAGLIVAGSRRADFPRQTESLVLGVAVNQAAIGLQEARLLSEQKRVARSLDERVAQRTSELAAANEALRKEVAERRRAEAALREKELHASLIVDSIPALIAIMTPAGEVEHVNRQVLEYFGRTLEEMKKWGTSEAVHPDDLPYAIESFGNSVATGLPYEIEHRIRRSDGEYRWFQARGLPLKDVSGRIVRWHVLLTDIDERKRAEEALRASEANLRKIINTLPTSVWSTRPDGYCDFLSQRWLDYAGFSADQAEGSGWGAVVHPDDAPGLVEHWQSCLASGAPVDAEARMRRFDGVYRWFLFRANPLRDEDGAIIKWYGTNIDIEDRRQADEKLRRSEIYLTEAQRLSQTGSFSRRLDTDEIAFSEELYRIFEFDRNAVVTLEQIGTRFHTEDIPFLFANIERLRSGGDGEFDYENRLQMPDGRIKHMRTFGHLIHHPDGRRECLGAVQDVTQRHLSDEALANARSKLAHVARITSLGVLTASIAHEINQPLAAIMTNGQTGLRWLTRPKPDIEKARELTERVVEDARRASEIIDRIRAMATGQPAKQTLLSLDDIVEESMVFLRHEFQSKSTSVSLDLAAALPRVVGDRTQLQQVLVNLAVNAIQAMSESGAMRRRMLIRTILSDPESVCCMVEDSGPGIDPTQIPRLFDTFFTTKDAGMGMGLPICRSIVEAHGGYIRADNDSVLGGARFSFTLPANVSPPAEPQPNR